MAKLASKRLLLLMSLLLAAQIVLGPGVAVSAPPASGSVVHVVRAGENLFRISLRYGTTVNAIMRANYLTSTTIYVGQRLVIPGNYVPPSGQTFTYVVQRGDTLHAIARRFGTTVTAIARMNGLVNPNHIYVGQRLRIPGRQPAPQPPSCGVWYTVRRGDTVSALALRYGTTVWDIVSANKLASANRIYIGQRLLIPCGGKVTVDRTYYEFSGQPRLQNTGMANFSANISPDGEVVTVFFNDLEEVLDSSKQDLASTRVVSLVFPVESNIDLRVRLDILGYIDRDPSARATLIVYHAGETLLPRLSSDPFSQFGDLVADDFRFLGLVATLPAGTDYAVTLVFLTERDPTDPDSGIYWTIEEIEATLEPLL